MWTQLPPEKRAHPPTQFFAHVYCGQMSRWIKTPLGTEVDHGPGHFVLDGFPGIERGTAAPLFSAHAYCGHGRPSQLLLSSCSRRPATANRTARRQFQATGQPVSRTQASDAMTSRQPRSEAKCVQHRCFQRGSVPLRSDIKGTELRPVNILIPLERQLIALQLCR